MGYATVADVQALNTARGTFTASSNPNLTQVSGFLDQTAAVLDGLLLAQGYQLPLPSDGSASSALALLTHYNALGAHALTERAAKSSPLVAEAEKLWEATQQMIVNGQVTLPGVIRDTQRVRPRGPDPCGSPFFSRHMWL